MSLFITAWGRAIVCLLVWATIAQAAVPQLINYQGRLTTATGQAVADGNYLVRFRIYDAPAGGSILWDNGFRGVLVTSGLFSYLLGDSTILPHDLFAADTVRYLGVTVGVDTEMSPRVRLTATAYGFKALRTDSAAYSNQVGTIDGATAGILTGDLTVSSGPGNSSIVLPNSSISAVEMLDEPGVVHGTGTGVTPGGPTNLVGRTINCPAAGFVVAIATGEAQVAHAQGLGNHTWVGLSEDAGGIPDNQRLNISLSPSLPTSNYEKQFSCAGMFTVSSAGPKTVYLIGQAVSGPQFAFFNCNLVLLYVPSDYNATLQ